MPVFIGLNEIPIIRIFYKVIITNVLLSNKAAQQRSYCAKLSAEVDSADEKVKKEKGKEKRKRKKMEERGVAEHQRLLLDSMVEDQREMEFAVERKIVNFAPLSKLDRP